ncbi:MAG: Ig-like domain-containing protein [Gemmatimonadales bacterium]
MRGLLVVLAISAPLASCSDAGTTSSPGRTIESVDVILAKSSLLIGETTVATAVVREPNGNIIANQPMTWSSSSPTTASISAAGAITAIFAGEVTITGAVGSRKGTARLLIARPPAPAVASVDIELPLDSLVEIGAYRARTVVRDVTGAVVQRVVSWSSSNPMVAAVGNTGTVVTRGVGSTLITAEVEGIRATVSVLVPGVSTVIPIVPSRVKVGEGYGLSATTLLANGKAVNRVVTWSVPDPAQGRIGLGNTFIATLPGTVVVRATSDGVFSDVPVIAYDWRIEQTVAGLRAVLPSDKRIAGDAVNPVYAEIVVGCEANAPYARVALPTFAPTGLAFRYEWGDYWYYGGEEEWTAVGAAVQVPFPTYFSEFITQVSTSSEYEISFLTTSGEWVSAIFRGAGLLKTLEPIVATCPAFRW